MSWSTPLLLLQGTANQLHKCIVSSPSGRGVFDGNVKVNRFAQRSDAGQLSRNLLLAPRWVAGCGVHGRRMRVGQARGVAGGQPLRVLCWVGHHSWYAAAHRCDDS